MILVCAGCERYLGQLEPLDEKGVKYGTCPECELEIGVGDGGEEAGLTFKVCARPRMPAYLELVPLTRRKLTGELSRLLHVVGAQDGELVHLKIMKVHK